MYRTYEKPSETELYLSMWDGDCFSYSVFESDEEMQKEKNRIEKIEADHKAKYEAYLKSI